MAKKTKEQNPTINYQSFLSSLCAIITDYFIYDSKIKDLYIFKRDPQNNYIKVCRSSIIFGDDKIHLLIDFNITNLTDNSFFTNIYGNMKIIIRIDMIKDPDIDTNYQYIISTNWDKFNWRTIFNFDDTKSICEWIEKFVRIVVDACTHYLIAGLSFELRKRWTNQNEIALLKRDVLKIKNLPILNDSRIDSSWFHYILCDKYQEIAFQIPNYIKCNIPHITFKSCRYRKDDIVVVGKFDDDIYYLDLETNIDGDGSKNVNLYSRIEDTKNIATIKSSDNCDFVQLITKIINYYSKNEDLKMSNFYNNK